MILWVHLLKTKASMYKTKIWNLRGLPRRVKMSKISHSHKQRRIINEFIMLNLHIHEKIVIFMKKFLISCGDLFLG